MKLVAYTWFALGTAAAVGCAGTLDDNYYDSTRGQSLPVKPMPAAGSSSWAAAGKAAPAAGKAAAVAGNAGGVAGRAGSASAAPRDAGAPSDTDSGPVAAAPAAGGGGTRATQPDAGPACDFKGLVQMKCGSASCHGAPATGSGLDLTTASLATRVDGRKGIGSCDDKLLIDKDNPTQSALYLRVTGATCGVKMPLGGSLTPNEQGCILSWIEGL
jgi:hypothetical protein